MKTPKIKALFGVVLLFLSIELLASQNKWCSLSGELLQDYPRTQYRVKLSDGSTKQYCCIRYLAEDFEAIQSRVQSISATDYHSHKKIDAKSAYYLVNSNIQGKWSRYSKLAFYEKEKALQYQEKHGGKIRDFDFTLYLANVDAKEDVKFFEKKIQRAYKKGEKIYTSVCDTIDLNNYYSLSNLKHAIDTQNLCVNLSEPNLQALSLYLWDIKRVGKVNAIDNKIDVPKKAKCPVCGMFVHKYPKWVGKTIMSDGKKFYFDGAKDMMKFYFDSSRYFEQYTQADFKQVLTTDYYSLKQLDAQKAWYVIGSNVYGPMGHELIPFETKEQAQTFKKNHFGKQVLQFKDISPQIIYDLDH